MPPTIDITARATPEKLEDELRSNIASLETQLAAHKRRLAELEGKPAPEPAKTSKKGEKKENKADEDKFVLEKAEMGNVVTRFPPEASGFMHIGHAKAALTNHLLAEKYKGRMIFRFDDTNPKKEDAAYEKAIEEDSKTLGLKYDRVTYTSDRFEEMLVLCEKMIKIGKAYCDDTETDLMREQRGEGIESKCRNQTIEQNLKMWEAMKTGAAQGTVVRAKISVDDDNKCLRDPVMYRVVIQHHVKCGDKYKVFPTYDFACPIMDSLDGVTHALRTSEYNDRNPQYYWICEALGLRKPHIQDFSRLNMEFTVMSKRKLTKFVDDGLVTGWDDPRMPTVKGLLRRGLKLSAIEKFIRSQGMSKANNFQEWAQLWHINGREIDPEVGSQCRRYTCIAKDASVPVTLSGEGLPGVEQRKKLLHKKNPELGDKMFTYGPKVLLEEEDMVLISDGEEVTLMDWGNVIIGKADRSADGKHVKSADAKLHLDGNFKKTKQKLTWIADTDNNKVPIELREFEHIITATKPDPEGNIEDVINRNTLATTMCYGEEACKDIKKGDIIQFERRGFFICDAVEPHHIMIYIPDGKAKKPHLSAWVREARLNAAPVAKQASQPDDRGMSLEEKRAKKKAMKVKSAAKAPAGPDASSLCIRVGKIVSIENHPDADSLFVEKIDLGDKEPRTIVSGLRNYYKAEELNGRKVAVLCNLKPAAMRGVESCGMVLCASDKEKTQVKVLDVPEAAPIGEQIKFNEYPGTPLDELPKKKVPGLLEALTTNSNGEAMWKASKFSTTAGPVTAPLKDALVR
eukprot:TRINITY_DN366_c0_g3_i1.p1 TRINITY_DN366_c0_g3~~TRINITY_DN366_c0_g3_i1.p1  ORF type:complete len:798 (+),score=208.41 TRINITY_DN366_c0_g3_i1:46-2439(+)